jgi:uncharacterized membrane protein YjgN (DUF898 family)
MNQVSGLHAPAAMPPPAPAGNERAHLDWAHPRGMLSLSIVNFLLRVVTLGLYHFWGKTEVRRRIWSAVRLNGEPLVYTGTGRELLTGFLLIFAGVVVPTMLISFGMVLLAGPGSPWLGVFQAALYTLFFFLTGFAIHRAQRYRLSRTQWRGIRGGMQGSAWSYAGTYFWTALLIPFTLGWIIPWRATRLQRQLVNDMRFGTRPLRFSAPAGPLYGRFVGLWFGGILIYGGFAAAVTAIFWPGFMRARELGLPFVPKATEVGLAILAFLLFSLLYGLVSAWYRAGMMNHFAAHTSFEGARFRASATAPGLIWLSISNFLIVLCGGIAATLGLMLLLGAGVGGMMAAMGRGWQDLGAMSQLAAQGLPVLMLIVGLAGLGILLPIAQARSARYFVEHLALDGELPVAAIVQGAEDDIRRGEGLAQAFDVDAF